MYKIIKNVIESKEYKLENILYKISIMYVEDRITEIEKDELDNLAREKAKPENSYDIQKQVDNIFARLEVIENAQKELKNKEKETAENENTQNIEETETTENETENTTESIEPVEPTEPTKTVEEYLEYIQPAGAHDSYKVGDKVKYKDKNYICKMDGCVWSPETYPLAWEVVEEIVGGQE